jgi:hypothetical protein
MIEEMQSLLRIDDATRVRARELWTLLMPQVDAIIEDFYAQLRSAGVHPGLTDETIARLKVQQRQHWEKLFHSSFDRDYANSLRRISIRHRDIDLSAGWYVAGYMALKSEFNAVIATSDLAPQDQLAFMDVLDRYVTIDMSLALSAFNALLID